MDFRRYGLRFAELKEVRRLYEEGHYLHRVRVGRQINYAVLNPSGGIGGAICYALPMMRQGYFGYTACQMLEFARLFLCRNTPGLAVFVIAMSLRRIAEDWYAKFPSAPRPEVIVSWHDTQHHRGTIYKAANFTFYKLTKPRRRGRTRGGKAFSGTRGYTPDDAHVKGTWVFPLTKHARKTIAEAIV